LKIRESGVCPEELWFIAEMRTEEKWRWLEMPMVTGYTDIDYN
jgi:hypothetical protein